MLVDHAVWLLNIPIFRHPSIPVQIGRLLSNRSAEQLRPLVPGRLDGF